jgi:DinB superfamily
MSRFVRRCPDIHPGATTLQPARPDAARGLTRSVYQSARTARRYDRGMLSIRPGTDEYGGFYTGYIARIRDGEWLDRLDRQPAEYRALLGGLDETRAQAPTAPGKWSVVEILSHVSDTERVFAFRLVWFARGAASELPGFDQDAWVEAARSQPRTLVDVIDEFATVRQATLALLRTVSDDVATRRGIANGNPMTVRACGWMIAGHAQHHLDGLRALGM